MASFEPIVVLFGSNEIIATIKLKLPVSFTFAIDESSLERLVTVDPKPSDTSLPRFFILLFNSIDKDLLDRLQANHRVQAIYSRDKLDTINQQKLRQIRKNTQQFTLNLTGDIVRFLKEQGEKQSKLERISLVKAYYR